MTVPYMQEIVHEIRPELWSINNVVHQKLEVLSGPIDPIHIPFLGFKTSKPVLL